MKMKGSQQMTCNKVISLFLNYVQPGHKPVHMFSNKMHVHRFVQVTKMLWVLKLPDVTMISWIMWEKPTLCTCKEKSLLKVSMFVTSWRTTPNVAEQLWLYYTEGRMGRTISELCIPYGAMELNSRSTLQPRHWGRARLELMDQQLCWSTSQMLFLVS